MRLELDKELKRLHKDIVKMEIAIEKSIDDMITALKTQDVQLARDIIKRDEIVDELQDKIEDECIMLIARQQPIASDLRLIASVLKMTTDLERIADHCEDISEYVILLADEKYKKDIEHLPKMANKVKSMVKDTIDAYIDGDAEKAKNTAKEDDVVDDYYRDIVVELQELMKKDSEMVVQGTYFLSIAKYLERMGDHSTNICNWIVYNITGKRKHYH